MFINRGLLKYISQIIEYYAANIKLYHGKDMFVKACFRKHRLILSHFLWNEGYILRGQLL